MGRRSKYTEALLIGFVREVDAGAKVADVCRRAGVTETTFYRWKARFGGTTVSKAQDRRRLEHENTRLKQLVADLSLDSHAEDSAGKKLVTTAKRRGVVTFFRETSELSERRTCRLVGVQRLTGLYRGRRPSATALVARLRVLAAARPRFGYRRLHVLLRREDAGDNVKRTTTVAAAEELCACRGSKILLAGRLEALRLAAERRLDRSRHMGPPPRPRLALWAALGFPDVDWPESGGPPSAGLSPRRSRAAARSRVGAGVRSSPPAPLRQSLTHLRTEQRQWRSSGS